MNVSPACVKYAVLDTKTKRRISDEFPTRIAADNFAATQSRTCTVIGYIKHARPNPHPPITEIRA